MGFGVRFGVWSRGLEINVWGVEVVVEQSVHAGS